MTQDPATKPSLLSRSAKPGPRTKPDTSSPTTAPRDDSSPAVHVEPAAADHADREPTAGRDAPMPLGPCAAALPQAAAPVAVCSPVIVRKTPAGAMHLGPEPARLYTAAEAVGLAREILRLFT